MLYDKLKDEIEGKRASILGSLRAAYVKSGMPPEDDLCHCSGKPWKEFCVVHTDECRLNVKRVDKSI